MARLIDSPDHAFRVHPADALGRTLGRGAMSSDLPAAIAAAIHELAG